MFYRLKNFEEDRKVSFLEASAIEINKNDITKAFETIYFFEIPNFIKKVKKTESGFLFLVSMGKVSIETIIENMKSSNKIDSYWIEDISRKSIVNVLVPEFVPYTKHQYEKANKKWPCNYINMFKEKIDEIQVEKHLKIVAHSAISLFFYETIFDSFANILNNNINEIIDSGIKNRKIEKNDSLLDLKVVLESKNITELILDIENSKIRYNLFCSNICVIAEDKEIITVEKDDEFIIGHAILKAVSNVSKSKLGYLCTGYSAYLFTEPCLSCAMALVHGRIKRVFCLFKGIKNKSFTENKINYHKSLNHRFDVFFHDYNK